MNILLKITALLAFLSLCDARLKCKPVNNPCGKNAEFREQCGCGDLTCENPDLLSTICLAGCKKGCFCKEGYIRDDNNNCILPEECPINSCPGAYESYKDCGTACPDTCSNYNETDRPCTKQCVAGCFCDEGFVRNDFEECVEPDQCQPQECGPNESYNGCGTSCPDTCENYQDSGRMCTEQCVPGCFCNKGLVRNEYGDCVNPDECSAQECGAHEHYTNCGSACPKTCDNYKDTGLMCIALCKAGCFCDEGYVKNKSGVCVTTNQCLSQECGDHESYLECGSACPDTCENYKDTSRICTLQCVLGCFCDKGYVRNGSGKCVEPNQCPS